MIVLIGMVLHILWNWTYTFESTNESGCTHTAIKFVTACDSFDWNGVTYTMVYIHLQLLML